MELGRLIVIIALLSFLFAFADDTIPPYVELLWPDSGAFVSCADVTIEMVIVDHEFFVDRSSILLTVSNFPHLHAIDEWTFSWVDSFFYFPIPMSMADGDSVWCLMNPVTDYEENCSEGFNWFFYIDLSGPYISDLSPAPGSEIADPHANLSAAVFDPAGLTEDSCFITVNGDTFPLFEGYAAWIGDTFTFYSGLAGLFFPGGDTVNVCVYAADAAQGCGANRSDTCWWFTITQGGPTAELIWPWMGAWLSCEDTTVRFRIEDSEGVEPDSIRIEMGLDEWTLADPELIWVPPFLYWDIADLPEGPIAGTLYAADIIGNCMEPPLPFALGLDFTPPYLINEIPAAGSAIFDLDPEVTFDLNDYLAGMMHGPTIAGVSVDGSATSWFALSDFELSVLDDSYRLDSLAIPPLHGGDTVSIRVIAFDSVNVCATNRLDTTWFFYVPYTPPDAELILPDSGIVTACGFQEIWFYLGDTDGILESSIRLQVSGFIYDLTDPEMSYTNDTLRFTPLSQWSHGSYVYGSLYYTEDILGNPLESPVYFVFQVDIQAPEIVSVSPPEFSLSADTLRQARIRIEDTPAGLDPASVQITVDGFPYIIDGTNLRWESPYLVFDPLFAGAWDDVDSVEICLVTASDAPDTCPPNETDPLCWTFFIDARDPVALPPEGAIVACVEQEIKLYLWAPGGIIDSTVLIEINGVPYMTADSRLSLESDTLIFTPDSPWPDGDSVRCQLVFAEGALGSIIDSVYWGFLMDYSEPTFISANPAPGEIVLSVDPPVGFNLVDSVSGLLPGAFELYVNGSSFGWDHPALSISSDSFTLDIIAAGLHLSGGDTAEICVHAEDLAYPEYCGPNFVDTCYEFTIEAGGPVAELLSPPELTPYGCDSTIVIAVNDHNGYIWATLVLFIDGEELLWDDPRLSISGDTVRIEYIPASGETLHVEFASLDDSLENPCAPNEWWVIFDFEPPEITWLYPSFDTTLTTTSPTASALVVEEITGREISIIEGMPFTTAGDSVFIDFSGLADYDTVMISLVASDSAVCPNSDTSTMRFFIDAAPPIADLILPNDSTTTLCNPQPIRILLIDPSGIDPTGLLVAFGGDTLGISDPHLRLSGDTLVYEPDTAFAPGFVTISIVYVKDRWGNVLTGFESGFIQLSFPAVTSVIPASGGSSSSTTPEIVVTFTDADSAWIVIGADTLTNGDPGFTFGDYDSVILNTGAAGLSWTAGDTVDLCASITGFADYCSPAIAETCWTFYIQYSPPTYNFTFPECSSWTACTTQNFVIEILDDDGVDTATITVSGGVDTFDISTPELSFDPITGELSFYPSTAWASDTIVFCLLSVSDILGAEAGDLPVCCEMFLDMEPPSAAFDPLPEEFLSIPDDPIGIIVSDDGSGPNLDSASVNGVWVLPSDTELDWTTPTAIFDIFPLLADPPPETALVCVALSDLVIYCGPNDTIICVEYPLNTQGPVLDLVFPGNGAITSCADGPFTFTAVDTHLYDPVSVRLVLDASVIDSLDPRISFPDDSTIMFTPDTTWLHATTICGTLVVADTLGALSEPYDFCVTIDIEPPVVSVFHPFGNVLDTFLTINLIATDSPAGVDIESPIITVNDDTTTYYWLGDTLSLNSDSLELCEFVPVNVEIFGLADNAAACGQNILPDTAWVFTILDDDTIAPSISSFEPGYTNSGIPFAVTAEILDTSGVYAAYILWNEGDSILPEADSVGMIEFAPGLWGSIDSIGPVNGDWVTVVLCATDDDFDCDNPADRSTGCDTFLIPLSPLLLEQIPYNNWKWNPDYFGTSVCAGEVFSSVVAFANPESLELNADSVALSVAEEIALLSCSDTSLASGETLYITLQLNSENEGDFSDTLFIYDSRFSYPIGIDTIYAVVRSCEFYAGPNPFSPNNDGFYDEFLIELPQTGDVEIKFFRLEGMRVATLRGNGRNYIWDGNDDTGRPQPPGIYIWVIRIDGDIFKHGSVVIAR